MFFKTATIFSKLFSTSTFVFLLSLATSKIILKHCKFKCGGAEQPRVIKNLFPDWLVPCTHKLWEKLWNRYHLDVFILAMKFSDWIYQNMVVFKEVALIFFFYHEIAPFKVTKIWEELSIKYLSLRDFLRFWG